MFSQKPFFVTGGDFTLKRSKRGAIVLSHSGYKYYHDYSHGERTSWRCIRKNKGCRASAVTCGSQIIHIKQDHSHTKEDSEEMCQESVSP